MGHVSDWLPVELESVALRLGRADQLIYELARGSFDWSSGSGGDTPLNLGYEWVCPHRLNLVVRGVREIPPLLPMLFSEALNHLRAAIDNTVFYLVGKAHGGPLTAKQEIAVAMPIYENEVDFKKWVDRTSGRVPELTGGTLGSRIQTLQPYADQHSRITSTRETLAALQGITPDYAHPLRLLQGYSNDDKHRNIRIAAVRTVYQREDVPFFDTDRTLRPVCVGDVLDTISYGTPTFVTTQAAVLVARPESGVAVSPAHELHHLAQYVSTVLLPTLVLGMALTESIPPKIDLSDNGQTSRTRIRAGTYDTGHERMVAETMNFVIAASTKPPRVLPLPPRPAHFTDTADESCCAQLSG